jgi:hypothetical protein
LSLLLCNVFILSIRSIGTIFPFVIIFHRNQNYDYKNYNAYHRKYPGRGRFYISFCRLILVNRVSACRLILIYGVLACRLITIYRVPAMSAKFGTFFDLKTTISTVHNQPLFYPFFCYGTGLKWSNHSTNQH